MSTCAVGPCLEPRQAGGIYCPKHGPRRGAEKPPAMAQRPDVACPHCGVRGHVVSKTLKVRRGISRKKVAGAVLTGAASLVAVGIGRNEQQTELSCRACGMTWRVG